MIRPYLHKDTEAIVSIWRLANQKSHPFLSDAYLETMQKVIQKRFVELSETHLYEQDGISIGFISAIEDDIAGLYVLPQYQRHGVGRTLLTHVLLQRDRVKLDVFARNRAGHRFYQRYGFVEIARRFDDTSGHEIIRMGYPP
ncbi:GNAT family N-acetyltransferase [uncultured Roseobacter sp.]|uniref:GNAT family N-acetyltransferase n=1 Tax=uncultured Roseobacter sp. TaxID=114847 RepID=UPI002606595E|nr:GNAT family N-acetyltransferase [uncultured Roseobacter sp.]